MMLKKVCSFVTILAFILFDWACTSYSVKKVPMSSATGKDIRVLGVMKKSGEYIKFPEEKPAFLIGDRIIGGASGSREVFLADVKSYKRSEDGVISELTTKNGFTYTNITGKVVGDTIVMLLPGSSAVSIPVSEVEMVWVRTTSALGVFASVVGGIFALGLVLALIVAATKKSCPFIYSFDGRGYVFDAEPYGGATSRGLKRTEWCGLEYLKPGRGEYRLRLTNEVNETQHTDELKLVAVDHPSGVQVVPDENGVFHTFAQPQPPLSARDQDGRDLMPSIRANDWMFWISRMDDKDPEKDSDLNDRLIFEFPKPTGANQVKLLFNGCNTLWGSQMVSRFLELYGDRVKDYYAAVDSLGPAYQAMMNWNMREELYRLQVRAETPDGWISIGTVAGGGPLVSESRAYVLDLAKVPGETLRLKLTPPAGFWMINHLAVDYSEDVPVRVTELEPARAVDSRGRDIRGLLARSDDIFYDAPDMGDSADVTYLVPPQTPGMARSVFCKASGYYDIHLTSTGKPRLDILRKLQTEPGFTVRFALREYQKWKTEHPLPQSVK
jgi:hypothetical protein